MAMDEIEEPGLYLHYADGSIEIYVLQCEGCGGEIDTEEPFYLQVQAAAPFIKGVHSHCASKIVEHR